jgi:ubiquinone/menaquinone biosynthesis C-methylase UbiE
MARRGAFNHRNSSGGLRGCRILWRYLKAFMDQINRDEQVRKIHTAAVIRESVRKFYDTFGWRLEETSGEYQNDLLHADLLEISKEYDKSCEARYWEYFKDGGHFFLDAGCGGKPIKQLGQKFQRHVCTDISLTGLMEARQKLGDRGLFVVADLAALPFKDNLFDGVVASYCLYHLDKHSQLSAMKEFYRVIRTKKNILVFYVAKNSLIFAAHKLGKALVKIRGLLSRLFSWRKGPSIATSPVLYFYALSPFRLSKGFRSVDITCLRTLTRVESIFLHKVGLLGPATRLFSFLERTFPHLMLWVGSNAAIKIQKTD